MQPIYYLKQDIPKQQPRNLDLLRKERLELGVLITELMDKY